MLQECGQTISGEHKGNNQAPLLPKWEQLGTRSLTDTTVDATEYQFALLHDYWDSRPDEKRSNGVVRAIRTHRRSRWLTQDDFLNVAGGPEEWRLAQVHMKNILFHKESAVGHLCLEPRIFWELLTRGIETIEELETVINDPTILSRRKRRVLKGLLQQWYSLST